MTKSKNKGGRPPIHIDENQLRGFCRLKPTLKDCADFFNCSEDTIEKECRRLGAKSFSEFRDQNMVHTRFSLIRTAIKQAENGNTAMMIFCLKNLCKWTDRFAEAGVDADGELTSSPLIKVSIMNPKGLDADSLKKEVLRFYDHPTGVIGVPGGEDSAA